MNQKQGYIAIVVTGIIASPLLLLIWTLIYPHSCWNLIIPLIVLLILAHATWEQLYQRRLCIAECYFNHGTMLHRLTSGTSVVALISISISLVLTIALLTSSVSWGFLELSVLALDALLVALLYVLFSHLAKEALGINSTFQHLFAKHWAVSANIIIVLIAFLVIQLQQTPPEWIDGSLDLRATLFSASEGVGSDCTVVDRLVRLNQEKDALSWWLMIKSTSGIEQSHIRWVAWLLFLVSGTLSIWAYSRLCVAFISLAHRMARRDLR